MPYSLRGVLCVSYVTRMFCHTELQHTIKVKSKTHNTCNLEVSSSRSGRATPYFWLTTTVVLIQSPQNNEPKKKVTCPPVQALRLCTGRTAHRGSKGTALPFHDHGTRRGWGGQRHAPAALYPGKDPVRIVQEDCGPQGRSGQVRKISPPPRFDPRTLQPVDSGYTDYATRLTVQWACYFHIRNEHVISKFSFTSEGTPSSLLFRRAAKILCVIKCMYKIQISK